jgi:hypothetical protein
VTNDGAVWITEAWRKIRDTLDMHEMIAAFDFRTRNIVCDDYAHRVQLGTLWAERMQIQLGGNYDVVAHGAGDSFHIHAEFDPR